MAENKNDNVIRTWTGPTVQQAHWCFECGEWSYYRLAHIYPGNMFCLNDEDHEPTQPTIVKTNNLEGLI